METIERVRQEREILDVISEQQKWFKYWRIIPAAVTVFFAVIYFALGIVYAVSESLGFLFLFWCGGAVFCALCYFILKIRLSYQVLHIYYLKKFLWI